MSRPTTALVLAALTASPAAAQMDALGIELNRLERLDGGCRLTFLVENETASDIEAMVFETVFFDPQGAVAQLTLLDFQEAPAGRTRVRQFDLANLPCDGISAFLLNDTETCTAEGGDSPVCGGVAATSRTSVEAVE